MYDSILIYKTTWELIKELPEAEQLKVFTALCNKWFEDTEPNLKGMAGAVYNQANLLAEKAKNRYAAAVENGKKGGAPKGSHNNPNGRKGTGTNQKTNQTSNQLINQNTNQLTNQKLTENLPKTNPNDNVNDNVNDNEKDKDKVKVNEKDKELFTPNGVLNTSSTLEKEYKLVFENIKTEEIRKNLEEWYSLVGKYDTKLTPDILRARLKALGESCSNNPTVIAYSIKQATLGGWKVFYKKEPQAQNSSNSFKKKEPDFSKQPTQVFTKNLINTEEFKEKELPEELQKEYEELLASVRGIGNDNI